MTRCAATDVRSGDVIAEPDRQRMLTWIRLLKE